MATSIQHQVTEDVWTAIDGSYTSGKYTGAIQDALLHACEVIKEKAGLEIDNVELINRAFSPNKPIITVANISTPTGIDFQKGVHMMWSEIFTGIRNPRAQEKHEDSQAHADAIILFVNFLLTMVAVAKGVFSKEAHLRLVLDEHFYETARYGQIPAGGVPKKFRLEVFLDILSRIRLLQSEKLKFY